MAATKKALFSDPRLSAVYTQAYKAQVKALGGSTPAAPFGTPKKTAPSAKDSVFGDLTQKRKARLKSHAILPRAGAPGRMPVGDALDKYLTVQRDEAKTRSVGGKVDSPHSTGFWGRLGDILLRGQYASANAVLQGTRANVRGASIVDTLQATAKGALKGLEGKKKKSFQDVAQYVSDAVHAAHTGKTPRQIRHGEGSLPGWVKALMIVPDIGLDPTTYLGVGLAGRAGKVGALKGSIKEMADQLEKLGIKGGPEFNHLMHTALTSGQTNQKAVRASITVRKDVEKAAKLGGNFHQTIIRKQLEEAGASRAAVDAGGKAAKDEMELSLIKLSQAIVDNAGYRNIALKPIGGFKIPGLRKLGTETGGLAEKGVEIPLSRYAVAAAAAPFKGLAGASSRLPGTFDPIKHTVDVFQKTFVNSAKVFPELHKLHLRLRSQGLSRVNAREQTIRKALGGFTEDQRRHIATSALNGMPAGLDIIVNKAGEKVDAAEWVGSRIHRAAQMFTNPRNMDGLDPRHVLNAEDINRFFKYSGMTIKGNFEKDPNFVFNSILSQSDKVGDAGHMVFALESAMEQALSKKLTYVGAREGWGAFDASSAVGRKMIEKDPSLAATAYPDVAKLRKEGWTEITGPGTPKEFEGHLFHPDTIEGLKRITNTLEDEKEMAKALGHINNLTGQWKFFVTVPNPGFHVRNSIGDWYVNMAEGISTRSHTKAAKIMRIKRLLETPPGPRKEAVMGASRRDIWNVTEQHPRWSKTKGFVKVKGGFKDFNGKHRDELNMAEIWAGYNHGGNRQNYTLGEFSNIFKRQGKKGNLKFDKLADLKAKAMDLSADREDYWRLAHFIHMVETNPKKLKTLEDIINYASERVQNGHFDYTDFTKRERQVMSNIIPFYKWIRKSLPYQTQMLFTKPGKVAVIPKIVRTISSVSGQPYQSGPYMDTQQVIPQWMRYGGFLPLGADGHPQKYFNIGSPFGDAATQFGGFQPGIRSVGSSLNPAVKAAFELYANKNFFTGAPVRSKDVQPGLGQWAKDLTYYGASQTPISRQVANIVAGKPNKMDALVSWASGVSIQSNTAERQMSELIRRDIATARQYTKWRKKYLKDHNLDPETKIPINLIPSDFKD